MDKDKLILRNEFTKSGFSIFNKNRIVELYPNYLCFYKEGDKLPKKIMNLSMVKCLWHK